MKLKSIIATAFFIFLFFLTVYFYVTRSTKLPSTITIGTGSPFGNYHRIGLKLKTLLEKSNAGLKVNLVTSKSLLEKLTLLKNKKIDIAFFQSAPSIGRELNSIANIYSEVFHVIVRKGLNINNIHDLKNKRVSIGTKGSGTELISKEILKYYDIKLQPNQIRQDSFKELIENKDKWDACFIVAGVGSQIIKELLKTGQHQLIPFEAAEGFSYQNYGYYLFTLPKGVYGGDPLTPAVDIKTLAVKACLVTIPETPGVVVKAVLSSLLDGEIRQTLNIKELTEEQAQKDISYPPHFGAESYFNRFKPPISADTVEAWNGIRESIAFAIICIYMGAAFVLRIIRQKKKDTVDHYLKKMNDILVVVKDFTSRKEIDEVYNKWLQIHTEVVDRFTNEELADKYFNEFLRQSEIVQTAINEKSKQLVT